MRMPFLKQENSATLIQLRFKELCGGYPYASVSEQETKVVSYAAVTLSLNSRMTAKKSWFGWPSYAWRPDMVRREDTKVHSNQRFLPPIQRDGLSVFTKNSAVTGQLKWAHQNHPFTWRSGIIDAQMKKFGIWRHPSKKNEIGKFLSTAAKNAGRHREVEKVTNHSVRKTSTSRLLDADVPENFVAQLSGHKSTESLQSYKSACAKHQKRQSLTLSRADLSGSRDEGLLSVHNQGLLWSSNWLDLRSDSRASRYGRFNLVCPFYNRETEGGRTFKVRRAKLWNKIPLDMRKKDAFKNVLKKYFLA